MTAIISRAEIVGGHDGRAEIEVEITYPNGGTATICLDEEACTGSLDAAGIASIRDLPGRPWSVVLPALDRTRPTASRPRSEAPGSDSPAPEGDHPCSTSSSATV